MAARGALWAYVDDVVSRWYGRPATPRSPRRRCRTLSRRTCDDLGSGPARVVTAANPVRVSSGASGRVGRQAHRRPGRHLELVAALPVADEGAGCAA